MRGRAERGDRFDSPTDHPQSDPITTFPDTVRGEALLLLGQRREAHSAFKNAITVDPDYWRAWLGLAVASSGSERNRALGHASHLYRNSKEIYETAVLLQREPE